MKGQAQSPNILVAGGEHLSPKPSAGLHGLGMAGGAAGHLTSLLQSLDFKATGGKKPPGSGIHVVREHPRQFSPQQQAMLVLHD